MTEEQLQAIRSRCEAATPGPWHEWYIGKVPSGIVCDALENGMAQTFNRIDESYPNAGANAFFIAAAREDVPALLNEVDTLRRQLAEAQAWGELQTALNVAVPRDDIDDLYTAYAYATAGSEVHARFPAVGRWLGKLREEVRP